MSPFFLRGGAGRLFCLYFPPTDGALRQAILFFPPFGEESNKSRVMIAAQARRLSAAGFGVLLVDPFGCGDSEGEFGDARWEIWRQDMRQAAAWLREQGATRLSCWAQRSGALLMADTAGELGELDRLLLWSPVLRGDMFLTQFLRLRLAADMLRGGQQESTKDMRQRLAAGECLEVAGYNLHPELVKAMDEQRLEGLDAARFRFIDWFEMVADEGRPLPLPARKLAESWSSQVTLHQQAVVGEAFWGTVEITRVSALLDATSRALAQEIA